MNRNEPDDILGALAQLPEIAQNAAVRSATLTRTLRALATTEAQVADAGRTTDIHDGYRRAERSRNSWVTRWLVRERLVPAVLCLAGALYTQGAVRKLASVFASEPASLMRATQETDCRAPLRRVVIEPRPPTGDARRRAG
jgi:hypothetical protein